MGFLGGYTEGCRFTGSFIFLEIVLQWLEYGSELFRCVSGDLCSLTRCWNGFMRISVIVGRWKVVDGPRSMPWLFGGHGNGVAGTFLI